MGMFENYYGISNNAIPYTENEILSAPKVTKPLEYYNKLGEFIGYAWHRGDSIVLEFNITGDVQYSEDVWEDAEDYLKNKVIKLIINDFRYSIVFESTVPAATNIKFNLNIDNSKNLIEGTYTFKLILVDEQSGTIQTLFPKTDLDKCVIYIK